MSTIRKIGFDPGFGNVNAAEVIQNENGQLDLATCTISSVVGVGSTDAGALSLTGIVNSGRKDRPHVVAFDGVEYLVGSGVINYARPLERMDFNRFSDSPELRALLYTALATLPPPPFGGPGGPEQHSIGLVVGLPVELMRDKKQSAAVEREMSKWVLGPHRVTVDDHESCFKIVAVKAKPQPMAAWLDWGFDLTGRWTNKAASIKAPALVLDVGFNTFDTFAVEKGDISLRYTHGDTLGMRRAAEIAADNIARRYGVELSLHEADDLVQAVVNGKRPSIFVDGQPTLVRNEIRQALQSLAADVLRFTERILGKQAKRFVILVAGGGALALGSRLVRQYEHAVVVPDPLLANARGLAKLAVRPGFLD